MMLHEANGLLKKEVLTEEKLWELNDLYILLDLDKEDFCKIIDLIGAEKLISKQCRYDKLAKAEREYDAKEKYKQAKIRLSEIANEKELLEDFILNYRKNQR